MPVYKKCAHHIAKYGAFMTRNVVSVTINQMNESILYIKMAYL